MDEEARVCVRRLDFVLVYSSFGVYSEVSCSIDSLGTLVQSGVFSWVVVILQVFLVFLVETKKQACMKTCPVYA